MKYPDENPNHVISREIQTKFEFYFVALIFTIFGFSIQIVTYYNIFSIISLICLLISGICGLSQFEKYYLSFRIYGYILDKKMGRKIKKSLNELETTKNELETKYKSVFTYQRATFIIGLIFLLVHKIGYKLI